MRDTRRSHKAFVVDPQERMDRRLAVYVLLTALCLGFLAGCGAGRAWACGSYEECLAFCENISEAEYYSSPLRVTYCSKAIAFKLDEISKKLDRQAEGTTPTDIIASGLRKRK